MEEIKRTDQRETGKPLPLHIQLIIVWVVHFAISIPLVFFLAILGTGTLHTDKVLNVLIGYFINFFYCFGRVLPEDAGILEFLFNSAVWAVIIVLAAKMVSLFRKSQGWEGFYFLGTLKEQVEAKAAKEREVVNKKNDTEHLGDR